MYFHAVFGHGKGMVVVAMVVYWRGRVHKRGAEGEGERFIGGENGVRRKEGGKANGVYSANAGCYGRSLAMLVKERACWLVTEQSVFSPVLCFRMSREETALSLAWMVYSCQRVA